MPFPSLDYAAILQSPYIVGAIVIATIVFVGAIVMGRRVDNSKPND